MTRLFFAAFLCMLALIAGSVHAEAERLSNPTLTALQQETRALVARIQSTVVTVYADNSPGWGSGVIIDSERGFVVTNEHVVSGEPERFTVVLHDGREMEGFVIATDPATDLALIAVAYGDEPFPDAAVWGDSNDVLVGDIVFVVGTPIDLSVPGSVTSGIVAGVHRINGQSPSDTYDDQIQVDAPINSGNSGGPLFSIDGRVIGIVNEIFLAQVTSQGSIFPFVPPGAGIGWNSGWIGIGFAIPAQVARFVTEEWRDHGRIRRGSVGISASSVTLSVGSDNERRIVLGVRVNAVVPGGPADRGGIRVGDVILSWNGNTTPDLHALGRTIAHTTVERPVTVTVWRDGIRLVLSVASEEQRVVAPVER